MEPHRRAYLALASAMIIVGSSVVVSKVIVASFPIFLASALRFAIASLILVPLLRRRERHILALSRRAWVILLLQALTGVFLFSVLLLYGLKFTSAAEAAIITSSTPAVVGLISFLLLRERPSLVKVGGIGLAMGGLLLINLLEAPGATARGSMPLLGNALVFGAVIGEALFTILPKAISPRLSPLRMATMVSVLGFLLFLPPALSEARSFDLTSLPWHAWLPILYSGVVVTVLAFLLWFQGIATVPASTAAVFTALMPVSAVALSYLLLREPFAWSHLWGGLCILVGLGLIVREPSASPRRSLPAPLHQ